MSTIMNYQPETSAMEEQKMIAATTEQMKNSFASNCEMQCKCLVVQEIQLILGISRNAAYLLVNNDPPFPVKKIGKAIRIPKAAFYNWLNSTVDNQAEIPKGVKCNG